MKNSSMPVQDIQTFCFFWEAMTISVFNGPDEQFSGRLMGGDMPELFLETQSADCWEDSETARALQFAINGIIEVLTSAHGNMYGVIKEALRINEGLELGSVRSPLSPVTEGDQKYSKAASLTESRNAFKRV